jgi:hypothetical protein
LGQRQLSNLDPVVGDETSHLARLHPAPFVIRGLTTSRLFRTGGSVSLQDDETQNQGASGTDSAEPLGY